MKKTRELLSLRKGTNNSIDIVMSEYCLFLISYYRNIYIVLISCYRTMDWNLVSSQNPWWADGEEMERDDKVSSALGKRQRFVPEFVEGNHLILGPRQTGKTTYLKLCMYELMKKGVPAKHCLYFVCNLVMNPQDVIDVVSLFKKSGGKYVFFDEISFVKNWERAVKQILEIKDLHEGMNFYFTGSTTLELQKERFPGRPIKVKEFLPLTFREFCNVF